MKQRACGETGKHIGVIAAAVFFVLCYAFAVYLSFRTSAYLFDSDASAELILSKMLAQDGGILSPYWCYSTELRFLNTQLVYAPLFWVFDSFRTVRVVGAAVLQAAYALSFLFMVRQAGVRRSYAFLSAGLLLLPTSVAYARIALMHCFFLPHLTIGFLLTGLLFAMLSKPGKSGRFFVCLALYLVLSVLAGVGGVRQLIVTFAPLMLVCLLQLCRRFADVSETCAGRERRRSALASGEARAFLLTLGGAAACVLGCAVNKLITDWQPLYRVSGFVDGMRISALHMSDIAGVVRALFHLFGYRAEAPALSLQGVSSLLAIGALSVSAVLAWTLVRDRKGELRLSILGNLFLSALVVSGAAMVLTSNTSYHYLIAATAFVPAMLAAVWERRGKPRSASLCRIGAAAVAAAFLFAAAVTDLYLIRDHSGEQVRNDTELAYEGLNYKEVDGTRRLRGVADWLTENGYRYGYADFWNCNVLQEMTDGALRPICVYYTADGPVYYDWLTDLRYREQIEEASPVFVLLYADYAASGAADAWLAQAERVYEDGAYAVYAFADNAAPSALLDR